MFGKPAFGAAAPSTSFGFGQPANTANPFGQQNQTLFGKPTTGFGSPSTSTFGQPAASGLFTSQPQQTNMFQTNTSTFGAAAPTTQSGFGATGLFGQQPASGGLFNSTATAFGQQNKPAAFGFGTAQQTPSLFGTQQPQNTSSIFNPAGNTGLFGGSTAFGGTQQAGTVVKFNPVTGTDTMMKNGSAQNISTKHHSITCMKEYENKSFEELRFEDYQANRKGPQQSTGFGGSAFGSPPTSTPSLFGQTDANKTAFGQTNAFGQTASPFGANTTAGFGMGAQTNTTGSLFGKPTGFSAPTSSAGFGFGTNTPQNANPFGATTANKPFGAATAQPLFGGATTQPNTSGFGTGLFSSAQNTGAGLFSKPAQPTAGFGTVGQNTGFSFNGPATTQSSLFTNTSKPLFGQTTGAAPAFGALNTQNTQSSLFGSSFGKPAAPAFGATQAPAFGSTLGGMGTTQNSPFGATNQQKPGGLFGNTGTTGLFSNTNTSFQTNAFGMGQPQQQQQSLMAQPEQQVNNLALLTTDPFGDAPHLAGLEPKYKTNMSSVSATDPKELKSLLDASKKVDMAHSSKLKVTPLKSARDSLFDSISKTPENTKSPLTDYRKTSCRRLILKPRGTGENTPGMNSTNILDVLTSEDKENRIADGSGGGGRSNPLRLNFDTTMHNDSLVNTSVETQTFNIANSTSKENFVDHSARESPPPPSDDEEDTNNRGGGDSVKKHPANIICTRPEYYTLPPLDELVPDEAGHCMVKGFTIGRRGYGNVFFPDEVDAAGLNIDELVHFRYREINVYPDDSKKPPIGQGLNKKAQVTLDNVFPRRTGSNALIKNVNELIQMNFAEKLRKVTEKKNARFVDYRPETGSWVFKVDHFSKYGFNDSDEENDQNGASGAKKTQKIGVKVGETPKIPKPAEAATKETLEERDQETDVVSGEASERSQEPSSVFRLDKDILIDEEDQEENDVLHHSMFVDDASEDDYHQIPDEIPMDIHYGPYSKGSNAKNIQVMKSTLFAEDDRSSDGAGSHISILKQYLDLPEIEDVPRLPTLREEVATRKRPMIRPRVWKVLSGIDGPEADSEVLPNRCCVDMGMFKGKSFKVGWSKGFNYYCVDSHELESSTELALKTFDASPDFDPLKDVLTDSLKVVLDESTHTLNPSKVPTFKILKTDSYLKKQTAIFEKLAGQYDSNRATYLHGIWTLCVALWGPNENTVANRRHLLTEWLKATCNGDETSDLENVFDSLSIFKVFEAANAAMDNRMPNLALLISQLSLANVTKSYVQEQVEIWYGSMASNHITREMKRLYLLLAGIPVKDEVNIFENVDWKRAFGMHMWFICPNGAPIETAIEQYKKSFEEYSYAERPNPPYAKNVSEEGAAFDIMYHILLLYKSGIHRLSSVLNPATHTDDPLDYRLSWLLFQLFLSLDVGLIETSEKNKLCTSFANQLEHLGHWEWAIFVLLHLEDDSVKKNIVMGILDRNLNADFEGNSQETIDMLVNDMKIPAEWIHIVKAPKSLLLDRTLEAFNHFALAEDFISANAIFVDDLLPSLFINEQFDVMRSLIEKLKPGSKDILRWNNEAGLFLEYLDLLDQSITNDNLVKLQMKLASISERIVNFPMASDAQKVCAAELSKRCASLYKELCKKSRTTLFKDSYAQFIETLIMPPDFKQNEGLYLIHDFYSFRINNRQ